MTNPPTGCAHRAGLDRLGVIASAACAIHCMVAPLLFLLIPSIAGIWAHPASHALIALLVIPLAFGVLRRGYRQHRKHWVAAAAVTGMVLIVVGALLPYLGGTGEVLAAADGGHCDGCCPQLVEDDEGGFSLEMPAASIVTVLGSFFLIAAHAGNLLGCRACAK